MTPPAEGLSNCRIACAPSVSGSVASVSLTATGNCAGAELETTIDIDRVLASSSGNAAVRSKITAWHYGEGAVPGIKMFWHYAKILWSYNVTRVLSGSLSTDYWEGGCGWELTEESERVVKTSVSFLGEHYTDWYADCGPLPDATAISKANATGRPGGGYSCYGRASFSGGIAGFRYTHSCLKH